MDNNVYVRETWTDNNILSETIENSSESENEPQKEGKITTVTIQQAKLILKTLRYFVETTTGMKDGAFSALSKLKDIVEEIKTNFNEFY